MRANTLHTSDAVFRIHYKEIDAISNLSNQLLKEIPFTTENILFLCIGTDRSTGDALGPLTGAHLTELQNFPFPIIGTLEEPLHALNLEQQLQSIQANYSDPFIVAIDACLGKETSIGQFLIQNKPLHPGQAVRKRLPPVGNLSIKGVVNISGCMEHAVLQSTRLHLPFQMSRTLTYALQLAYYRAYLPKTSETFLE